MLFSTITLILVLARAGCGLRVTRGSPCENECGGPKSNTTGDEIVCRDDQFSQGIGTRFESCVKCELRSTFVSNRLGESDVKWGLYNLRYAFSSCIYGFPAVKQSLSTPCQVSCEKLRDAMGMGLMDPTGTSTYDFCGLAGFADPLVTKCAACYARTEDEKYMANFVEALREGCHVKVPDGSEFLLDPDKIFTTEILPATTAPARPKPTESKEDKSKTPLVLVIVLPILGCFLLLLGCCVACFFCVRRRRRKAKERSQGSYLHERWNDTGIMSPLPGTLRGSWGEPNSAYQPQVYSPQPQVYSPQPQVYNPQPQVYSPYPPDIKYPPETYQMDTSPSTSSPAGQSIDYVQNISVPILSQPPPPRKSLSNP
ncbi:hypothetical protein AJ80_07158 [Polytolypa hystricis UAMH7299]|uniref:WSC domain-containing protein n=1 Tax=Polytolypa hystricis (strain UAMH7299) TaxID=1447883 RepID=A0A2B7XSB7_POLH7|nr:hypothetical protein AJ80_07158 [Polytolypa hystricis UAMH7299]